MIWFPSAIMKPQKHKNHIFIDFFNNLISARFFSIQMTSCHKDNLGNIDIDKEYLENIDIDIDKDNIENIDMTRCHLNRKKRAEIKLLKKSMNM